MKSVLTAINSRASALKLSEPAPTREHLQQIMAAGARAPDHGRLAPWQFVVLEGKAREILSEAAVAMLRAADPAATAEHITRERDKSLRAPCIVVVAARVNKQHKVPEIEQLLAVGAATQNMFLVAQELGYGVMWKTGPAAYDTGVKVALGLQADDHIVGFLYLGTTAMPGKLREAQLEGHVRWL